MSPDEDGEPEVQSGESNAVPATNDERTNEQTNVRTDDAIGNDELMRTMNSSMTAMMERMMSTFMTNMNAMNEQQNMARLAEIQRIREQREKYLRHMNEHLNDARAA